MVASEQSGREDQPVQDHEPRECMPCRGTGRVISNLGGTPSEVTCPWCEGGGIRLPGHDAQARWPAQGDGGRPASASGPAPDGGAATQHGDSDAARPSSS